MGGKKWRGERGPVHVVAWSVRGEVLFQFWVEGLWLLRIVCRRVRVLAVTVMPTHVHVVLADRRDVGKLGRALGAWARLRNHLRGGGGRAWRRARFVEEILDEGHLEKVLVYVHRNPVPEGLVRDPLEWPLSTYRDALGLTLRPLVPPLRDPSRHHALVSSGKKVVGGIVPEGTPFPAGVRGEVRFRDVVAATCAASGRLPGELRRPGPLRDLLVQLARARTDVPLARVAEWLELHPAQLSRALGRPRPREEVRLVERLLGDPRFALLAERQDLSRLAIWARYRHRTRPLPPPGPLGHRARRRILGPDFG